MAPEKEDVTPGSILRELVLNQYQAIVLGGTAVASLVTLNPLPLLLWLGSELVLLPILDSGPLRRLVARRRLALAQADAASSRNRLVAGLSPDNAKRYDAMARLCGMIEANYQGLSGISQAYLSEQRDKLDLILRGCLLRLIALQRYDSMPMDRRPNEIEHEIAALERELTDTTLPERATVAVKKNLELKRRLLASFGEVEGTVKTLVTELDSMESLLEVLYQNSVSLRDPQAISEELDTIVRQSEDTERIVREMETLLQTDTAGWSGDLAPVSAPTSSGSAPIPRLDTRRPVKRR